MRSRRSFFKAGVALANAAALRAEAARPNHRILLKGGTIVSMDPKVGDFVKGDVLI